LQYPALKFILEEGNLRGGTVKVRRKKNIIYSVLALSAAFGIFCVNSHGIDDSPYTPPIVFAGFLGNDYDSLPGNSDWPNTCTLAGDTVRMYFYSEKFAEVNKCRSGDLLRMDLLPRANDSLLGLRDIIFHLARYLETNYSYDVVPADTLQNQKTVAMRAIRLSRTQGGAIDLDRISIQVKALDIHDGRIFGTIK
jgi:hypothetical protein